jgi:hypothetical protein
MGRGFSNECIARDKGERIAVLICLLLTAVLSAGRFVDISASA